MPGAERLFLRPFRGYRLAATTIPLALASKANPGGIALTPSKAYLKSEHSAYRPVT